MAESGSNDPILSPEVTMAKLNAISRKYALGLDFKINLDDNSVQAHLPEKASIAFNDFNNPMPSELMGSFRFGRDWAGSIETRNRQKNPPEVLIASVAQSDIDKFEHNAPAIKLFMDGKYPEAKKLLAELQPPKVYSGYELADTLRSSAHFSNAGKNGELTANLSPTQAKHLDAVLNAGTLKPYEVFGSDKIRFDKTHHTLTLSGGMTDAEISHFNGQRKVLDTALQSGNGTITKAVKQSLDANSGSHTPAVAPKPQLQLPAKTPVVGGRPLH